MNKYLNVLAFGLLMSTSVLASSDTSSSSSSSSSRAASAWEDDPVTWFNQHEDGVPQNVPASILDYVESKKAHILEQQQQNLAVQQKLEEEISGLTDLLNQKNGTKLTPLLLKAKKTVASELSFSNKQLDDDLVFFQRTPTILSTLSKLMAAYLTYRDICVTPIYCDTAGYLPFNTADLEYQERALSVYLMREQVGKMDERFPLVAFLIKKDYSHLNYELISVGDLDADAQSTLRSKFIETFLHQNINVGAFPLISLKTVKSNQSPKIDFSLPQQPEQLDGHTRFMLRTQFEEIFLGYTDDNKEAIQIEMNNWIQNFMIKYNARPSLDVFNANMAAMELLKQESFNKIQAANEFSNENLLETDLLSFEKVSADIEKAKEERTFLDDVAKILEDIMDVVRKKGQVT